MDHQSFLSSAAQRFQESAIRKTGALAGRVPDLISFAPGYPASELFPWDELKAIAVSLLDRHDGSVLQYGATQGFRPLIDEIVKLLTKRGVAAASDDVIVTTGSQQGLDLAGRVLLDPGDVVLVELPTYSGAIAAFHNLQAELLGIPQDGEGLSIDPLEAAVRHARANGRRVRVVYVTPNFQNPTGLLMSQRRRRALLEAAVRLDLVILEDDPYGSLYFEDATTEADTRPIKADDAEDRVVYLGSMSKTLVPGFRVGWMVAPAAIAEKVELAKQATDLCTGIFDQRIVQQALSSGLVDRLAPQLRSHYQAKRSAMETALRDVLGNRVQWTRPRGGFFLWAEFRDGVDDRVLFEHAVNARVSFVIGSAFFVNGEGHQYARLSFSAPTAERIHEGVARLRCALDAALTDSSSIHAKSATQPSQKGV